MLARTLFMWGYQPHFQIGAKTSAKQVLKRLAPKLRPEILLVGVLEEDREGCYPICIEPEPEDCGVPPDVFEHVKERAARLLEEDEESRMLHTLPEAEETHTEHVKKRSLAGAIRECLEDYDPEGVFFSSLPQPVEGYMVTTILRLDQYTWSSYYQLSKSQVRIGRKVRIYTSLIDAAIAELLEQCSLALRRPDPGRSFQPLSLEAEEFIRRAGKSLMYTPAVAAGAIMGGGEILFGTCNVVSSLPYEGAESSGRMIVAKREHPNVVPVVQLGTPVALNKPRAVRKLVQIADTDLDLLTDGQSVYGFGHVKEGYDHSQEDLFVVEFFGHYQWELSHAERTLMRVTYGLPHMPVSRLDPAKLRDIFTRIFPAASETDEERIWGLVEAVMEQKHGTMLVIANRAAAEAGRLRDQSTPVEPMRLSQEVIANLSKIDGAILIDPEGVCYAVGVILDGRASPKGSATRGARYNSAVRYVETEKAEQGRYESCAVVVSEDGSVDLVPDLRPRVRKSAVAQAVCALEGVVSAEDVDEQKYYRIMDWLQDHSFYLSREQCDKVNVGRVEFLARPYEEPGEIRITFPEVRPDEEMDESYFVEE